MAHRIGSDHQRTLPTNIPLALEGYVHQLDSTNSVLGEHQSLNAGTVDLVVGVSGVVLISKHGRLDQLDTSDVEHGAISIRTVVVAVVLMDSRETICGNVLHEEVVVCRLQDAILLAGDVLVVEVLSGLEQSGFPGGKLGGSGCRDQACIGDHKATIGAGDGSCGGCGKIEVTHNHVVELQGEPLTHHLGVLGTSLEVSHFLVQVVNEAMADQEAVDGDYPLRLRGNLAQDFGTRDMVLGIRHITKYWELRRPTIRDGVNNMLIQSNGLLLKLGNTIVDYSLPRGVLLI